MLNCNNGGQVYLERGQQQHQIKRINQYLFDLCDEIGRGYSSVVYQGKDLLTGEIVAIKVIQLKKIANQVEKKLMNNEIRALKSLDHPNVLKAKQVLQTSNNLYVVTEFYETSLEGLLRRRDKFSELQVMNFIEKMAEVLCYLQEKRIVHRDIKPSNIFVHRNNFVLGDFGFCSFRNPYSLQPQSVHYNVGSPLYMSPQSFRASIYSVKSDIWSLGMCIIELILGQKPFQNIKREAMKLILQGNSFIENLPTTNCIKNVLRGIFVPDPYARIYPSEILRSIQSQNKICKEEKSRKQAIPNLQKIQLNRKISCGIPLRCNRIKEGVQSQRQSSCHSPSFTTQSPKKFINPQVPIKLQVPHSPHKNLPKNQSLKVLNVCNKSISQANCNPFIKILKQLSQDFMFQESPSKIKLIKLLLKISPPFRDPPPILLQIESLSVSDDYLEYILANIGSKSWKQYDQYLLYLIQKCAKQAIEQYDKKIVMKEAALKIFRVLYEFYQDYKQKRHLLQRQKNKKAQDYYVPERPSPKQFDQLYIYWAQQN